MLVTSYTLTTGFTSGVSYGFRLRALDSIGYGPYSKELFVVPLTTPDQSDPPTTVIDGVNVKVSWNAPYGHGAPIKSYKVYIKRGDGTFVLEDTYCKSSDPLTTSNMHCKIPMAVLTGPIYSLQKGDLI